MKIAVVSPNKHHLQDLGATLQAKSHTVSLIDGGKSRMRAVADQERPDLMLVDGMCCDPNELVQVEFVTTHHPDIAVILMCANQTPEFLINSMRAGVREVLPSPPPAAALEAAVRRVEAKLMSARNRSTGRVLAFMPCKGGSGATFLATNLGWQLAQTNSVLLIDLNLQFGDALSFVHDGKPPSTLANVAKEINRLDASFLQACTVKVAPNFRILAAPEDPAQAMEVKPEHIDTIVKLAASHFDFVILDVPRGLDTLTIKALDHAWRIYAVLQAGLPSVRNATKLLDVFRSLGYATDRIELIVNRFEKGGAIGIEDIRRSLGAFNVSTVPNSYKDVSASINHGDPLAKSAKSSAVAKNLAEFASVLSPMPEEEDRGLLGRLFRRA
jgi:pilus assembly protein CpaE